MAKCDVNGEGAHPAFEYLRIEAKELSGANITWNFTKFLVNSEGKVTNHYDPEVHPNDLLPDIERLLYPERVGENYH